MANWFPLYILIERALSTPYNQYQGRLCGSNEAELKDVPFSKCALVSMLTILSDTNNNLIATLFLYIFMLS